jgi:ABC-type histidine transport system ATPase subunit
MLEATLKKPNELSATTCLNQIVNFLDQQASFKYTVNENQITIQQSEDKKMISVNIADVEKVLSRVDYDGAQFLQVNFHGQLKILITKNLVGFKPIETLGFDSQKIPKVVTTVDLVSIVSAIEDLYDSEDNQQTLTEIEVLKKVFQSILVGAEAVGFDMRAEKLWFSRNLLNQSAASA